MPVSGRPDFWRWFYFALLLFLSSGLCIGRFRLTAPLQQRRYCTPRLARRLGNLWTFKPPERLYNPTDPKGSHGDLLRNVDISRWASSPRTNTFIVAMASTSFQDP